MIRLASLVVLSLACVAWQASAQAADSRPNILFIMSDDHGYQTISAYGSKVDKTPNLDAWPRKGYGSIARL